MIRLLRPMLVVVLVGFLALGGLSIGAVASIDGSTSAPAIDSEGGTDRANYTTASRIDDGHEVYATSATVGSSHDLIGPAPEPSTESTEFASGPSNDLTGFTARSSHDIAGIAPDTQHATATADRTIELRQSYRLVPDQRGEIEIRHRYIIPDNVADLEATLDPDATVVDRSGFDEGDGDSWVWDEATDRPTITYRMPADVTTDARGPTAADGQLMFTDQGDWALVNRPTTSHQWGWYGGGRVGFERTPLVDGDGAASDVMVFLGPMEEHRHRAHGQQFRLIVPEAADLREDPEDIFESLSGASDSLRVGSRDAEVFVIAAPTDGVDWGYRGLQTGPADMWVRDFERLDDPDNIWLHEYVHTRQDYEVADDFRWFTEGSAVYYAALLTLEQERIDFERFQERLDRGTSSRFDDVRLVDRGTWRSNNADYHVGALVVGELDRQIRTETDSERSFQDVFSRINTHGSAVTAARFERFLRDVGGADVQSAGDRYTRTTDRPSMWSADDHLRMYGVEPARFSYELDPAGFAVDGPYRSGDLDGEGSVVLVPEETLTLSATVSNRGESEGTYEAPLGIDGEEQAVERGRLAPGESTTLSFDHRFDEVGEYTVSVGDATVLVEVLEPSTVEIRGFAADRTELDPGETVRLEVAVENEANYPGAIDLPITLDGAELDRQHVRLSPEASTTVEFEHTLDEPGQYTFGLGEAGNETVVVTVDDGAATDGTVADEHDDSGLDETVADSVPGFGIPAAVAALVGTLAIAARRNR